MIMCFTVGKACLSFSCILNVDFLLFGEPFWSLECESLSFPAFSSGLEFVCWIFSLVFSQSQYLGISKNAYLYSPPQLAAVLICYRCKRWTARCPLWWGCKKRNEKWNRHTNHFSSMKYAQVCSISHTTSLTPSFFNFLSFFHFSPFHFLSMSLFTLTYSYWLRQSIGIIMFSLIVLIRRCLFNDSPYSKSHLRLIEWVSLFFCVLLWHTRFELDWIAYAIFISGDWAFDIDDTNSSRPSAQITLLLCRRSRSSKRIMIYKWTGNWGYLWCEWTGNGM